MNPGGNQVSDDGHWQLVNGEWVPTQMQIDTLAAGATAHQAASQLQAGGVTQAFAQSPQTVVVTSEGGGAGKILMIVGIIIAIFVVLSVVLSAVLYMWASSIVGDGDSASGSLDAYAWSDDDANNDPAMSDGSGDALVEITMDQGTDLNWAMLKVTISVDGGTPVSCGEADDAEADCTWAPFGGPGNDQAWEAGEGITISEGDVNLCDGEDGGCSVEVTLIKKGTGSDADKEIGTVNAHADSAQ